MAPRRFPRPTPRAVARTRPRRSRGRSTRSVHAAVAMRSPTRRPWRATSCSGRSTAPRSSLDIRPAPRRPPCDEQRPVALRHAHGSHQSGGGEAACVVVRDRPPPAHHVPPWLKRRCAHPRQPLEALERPGARGNRRATHRHRLRCAANATAATKRPSGQPSISEALPAALLPAADRAARLASNFSPSAFAGATRGRPQTHVDGFAEGLCLGFRPGPKCGHRCRSRYGPSRDQAPRAALTST
jgi:hypothetical protein